MTKTNTYRGQIPAHFLRPTTKVKHLDWVADLDVIGLGDLEVVQDLNIALGRNPHAGVDFDHRWYE